MPLFANSALPHFSGGNFYDVAGDIHFHVEGVNRLPSVCKPEEEGHGIAPSWAPTPRAFTFPMAPTSVSDSPYFLPSDSPFEPNLPALSTSRSDPSAGSTKRYVSPVYDRASLSSDVDAKHELDDDAPCSHPSSSHSNAEPMHRRRSKPCEESRMSKTKCERTAAGPVVRCSACLTLEIDALEARLHQMEVLVGILPTAANAKDERLVCQSRSHTGDKRYSSLPPPPPVPTPHNTTVFVGGLSPLVGKETVTAIFAPFGEIQHVSLRFPTRFVSSLICTRHR
jgi:hypothetical protein